jgi:2-succinyl-5-enolpyruvyl-6-hydroxy-3-cyclohexene-1-carboxylate synthase
VPDAHPTALANRACARALLHALAQSGVRHVVVAPGSRSTALAMAAYEHPDLQLTVHWDERGAAFFALGIGRATGLPAVWITTSGTAVANGMPAAVEADADGVSLLLLTADRPPNLRETGANQTIRQPGFFADLARWSFDLPVPLADLDPSAWATAGAYAAMSAQHPHPGPVHLNAPFAKPLWPDPSAPPPTPPPSAPSYAFAQTCPPTDGLAAALRGVERGIVIAGRLRSRSEADTAQRLADHLAWALLPDVCSQARLGASAAAAQHDLALASDAFLGESRPDGVVLVGAMPTSSRLLRLLDASRPQVWASVTPYPVRIDPYHRCTHALTGDVTRTLLQLAGALPSRPGGPWADRWHRASQAAWDAVRPLLQGNALSEPTTAYALSTLLPAGEPLIVAASLPIRDLQTFAASDGARVPVYANRGASGIDGTIATAAGVARGTGSGATLLIGDLALLHDLNSLALLASLPERVVVVCVNNDGGGIFGALPVAAYGASDGTDPFECLFGTPHGLTFGAAAQQFGLAYACPNSTSAFHAAYTDALARQRATLIEIQTRRQDQTRTDLLAAARQAIDSMQGG